MRTSRASAPIRSAAASAMAPTVIEWLCVPGRAADQLLKQRVGVVAQLEQADPRDDSQGVLDERQAAAQEEAGHQSPAGAPEAVAADQARAAGPATGRWPRS